MFINLLLVSRECLSGQQPLERAVYLPTTKNSLKTDKKDLLFYGQSEVLPSPKEFKPLPSVVESIVASSDSESVDSAFSSTRPKRKAKCVSRNPGLSKEDVWLYVYADSLGYDPYDCDCELYD